MKNFYNTFMLTCLISALSFFTELNAQYYSLHFDGIDNYVGNMTENVITGNTPFTIEAWVKYDGGGFSAIINRGVTASWVYNMYGTIAFGIYLGEPPSYVVAPPPSLNQWHHIAGVRSANGELYIFIDGFKLGTLIVGNNNLISNQTNLKFGKYFSDSFFKGSMTKIRISKIARYTNNFVPTTNYQNDIYTVGLWKFEEGSGTILHDASSNNIHGTIYGTPEWSTDYPTSSGIWEKDLLIVDNGGQNKTITYGQSFEATDSLDVELGEYELPPVPPTGVFDARFNLPTTPIIGSLKDIRNADDTSIVWTMTFQPGISGYPITFDWSSGTIPDLGNYFLKDYFGLVNVNMRSNSSYTLTNPAITALKIEAIGTVRRAVNVLQGWNILSVPVFTLDMFKNTLYPGATTNFFGYNNGYQIVDTLQSGKGYWAKYGTSQTFEVTGNLVDPPNVLVNNDWNIIGPFDYNVPVADITSTPGGIIATNFFGFNNGYQIADTLKVGKGYWVRANSSGTLHLNNLLISAPTSERLNAMALLEANFTVTDGAGGTTLLIAGIDSLATDGLDPTLGEYEIPPLPPAGVFDARFNLPSSTISTITDIRQGTFAGGFNRVHEIQYQLGTGTTITINYDFGTYTVDQVKARIQDVVTGTLIDTTVFGSGSYSVPNPGVFNKLKITMIYGTSIPVELTSFIASSIDKNVNLQWSTATETNNSGFSIERKNKNENNWNSVAFVNGRGTTTELTNYTYTDKNLAAGIYNYRLKQIDFDGGFEYSKIIEVEVNVPKKFTLEQNYPNPFNPSTVINFEIPKQSNVLLKVYDLLGNEVVTLVNEEKIAGSYQAVFDATALSNGVYFYRLQAGSFVETKKMILMK